MPVETNSRNVPQTLPGCGTDRSTWPRTDARRNGAHWCNELARQKGEAELTEHKLISARTVAANLDVLFDQHFKRRSGS